MYRPDQPPLPPAAVETRPESLLADVPFTRPDVEDEPTPSLAQFTRPIEPVAPLMAITTISRQPLSREVAAEVEVPERAVKTPVAETEPSKPPVRIAERAADPHKEPPMPETPVAASPGGTATKFDFSPSRMLGVAMTQAGLEIGQNIPKIHEVMPEPFDVTNHAGNMWVGAAIAATAAIPYSIKNNVGEDVGMTIDQASMDRFRKFGIATICGATALANTITETKWGVQNLPVADWLNGENPGVLDTLYSTTWAGIASMLFWRKQG